MADQPTATRHCHEVRLETDQTARWNVIFQTRTSLTVRFHIGQFPATTTDLFHDTALVSVFQVDRQILIRLAFFTVDLFVHDARFTDGQFEAFTAHGFQQDGQVQLATTRDTEYVRIRCVFHLQGDVSQQFLGQTITDLATGDELAFSTRQWRTVHHEVHGQGRLIHAQYWQTYRIVFVANRNADTDLIQTGDDDDVPRFRAINRHAIQTLEAQHLVDTSRADLVAMVHHHDILTRFDTTIQHTTNPQTTGKGGVIQRCQLQLQRRFWITWRRSNELQNRFKQRLHIRC